MAAELFSNNTFCCHVNHKNYNFLDCNWFKMNDWGFVEQFDIDNAYLNNQKIHLNKKGIAILANDFVNNIVH